MGHVISLDGVRMAHRHVIAELLARLPDSDFVDELIAGADANEKKKRPSRARCAAWRPIAPSSMRWSRKLRATREQRGES